MRFLLMLSLLLPLSAFAASTGKKIQCWTDDKGHRSCGDYVPPQYVKKEVDVLNKQGIVIEKKAREKTPEEQAEADRQATAAVQAQKDAQSRAAYDRFLLDTYSSSKELEKARDVRVQTLDSRIALTQKAVADNQQSLADLRARPQSKPADPNDPKKVEGAKKVNERLNKQIAGFEKTLNDNQLALKAMQQEREKTVVKFSDDIRRWQELKGLAPAAAPATPAVEPH